MVYANDLIGSHIGTNTQSRCKKAIRHIISSHDNWVIYLGAGYKKEGQVSLKDVMKTYLEKELTRYHFHSENRVLMRDNQTVQIITTPTQAYGSFPETESVVALLDTTHTRKITVVTGLNHIGRVKMIWGFFPKYKVDFVASPMEYNVGALLEPAKIIALALGIKTRYKKPQR